MRLQQLTHAGHDIGLGNGLPEADGKGAVFIGASPVCLRDKEVAGHGLHRLEDFLCADSTGPQLVFHHAGTQEGEVPIFLTARESHSTYPFSIYSLSILRPSYLRFRFRDSRETRKTRKRKTRIPAMGTNSRRMLPMKVTKSSKKLMKGLATPAPGWSLLPGPLACLRARSRRLPLRPVRKPSARRSPGFA